MIDEIKKALAEATADVTENKSNKFTKDNYITKHLTTAERLNMIKGIPNSAFYYLGQVNAWKEKFHNDLTFVNRELGLDQVILKSDLYFIDFYSEQFCQAMGWN